MAVVLVAARLHRLLLRPVRTDLDPIVLVAAQAPSDFILTSYQPQPPLVPEAARKQLGWSVFRKLRGVGIANWENSLAAGLPHHG
jgi:hypothetical protein